MKNATKWIGLALAALGLTIGRAEADIVQPGSTYQVAVLDSTGDGTAIGPFTVNGMAQNFTYHGVVITVTESESNLGGGQYSITINLSASSDIFPKPGGAGFVNVGVFSDPLALTAPFDLTSALLTYKNGSGSVVASADDIGVVAHPDPWDGFFPTSGIAEGFTGTTGLDVQDINLQFQGTVLVPEPATIIPAGIVGLMGLGYAWLKRRRARAAG